MKITTATKPPHMTKGPESTDDDSINMFINVTVRMVVLPPTFRTGPGQSLTSDGPDTSGSARRERGAILRFTDGPRCRDETQTQQDENLNQGAAGG